MSGQRKQELDELSRRVTDGSYRVDPGAIADAILQLARLSKAQRGSAALLLAGTAAAPSRRDRGGETGRAPRRLTA